MASINNTDNNNDVTVQDQPMCTVPGCHTTTSLRRDGTPFSFCWTHANVFRHSALIAQTTQMNNQDLPEGEHGTCQYQDCTKKTKRQISNPNKFYKFCRECSDKLQGTFCITKLIAELKRAKTYIETNGITHDTKLDEQLYELDTLTADIKTIIQHKVGAKRKR